MPELKSLVLRSVDETGDYTFRVALLQREEADRWEQRISTWARQPEALEFFGPPLDLSEAMDRLQTRDFAVIDVPQLNA
jgi:hypothetical protein